MLLDGEPVALPGPERRHRRRHRHGPPALQARAGLHGRRERHARRRADQGLRPARPRRCPTAGRGAVDARTASPSTPTPLVEELPVGIQQRVEIIKALVPRRPVPDPRRADGRAHADGDRGAPRHRPAAPRPTVGPIVFITHKLREVLAVADRISVLRRGKTGRAPPTRRRTTPAELADAHGGPRREARGRQGRRPTPGARGARRSTTSRCSTTASTPWSTASTSRSAPARSSPSPASTATARPSWCRPSPGSAGPTAGTGPARRQRRHAAPARRACSTSASATSPRTASATGSSGPSACRTTWCSTAGARSPSPRGIRIDRGRGAGQRREAGRGVRHPHASGRRRRRHALGRQPAEGDRRPGVVRRRLACSSSPSPPAASTSAPSSTSTPAPSSAATPARRAPRLLGARRGAGPGRPRRGHVPRARSSASSRATDLTRENVGLLMAGQSLPEAPRRRAEHEPEVVDVSERAPRRRAVGGLHAAGDPHRHALRGARHHLQRPRHPRGVERLLQRPARRALEASWDVVYDAYYAAVRLVAERHRPHQPHARRGDAAALRRALGRPRLPGRAVQHRRRRPADDGRHLRPPTSGSPSTCPPSCTCRSPSLAGLAGGMVWGAIAGVPQGQDRGPRGDLHDHAQLHRPAPPRLPAQPRDLPARPAATTPSPRRSLETRPAARAARALRRRHAGLLLALAAAVGVWWLLERSTVGFRMRAVGTNPDAARAAGMGVGGTYLLAMALAGGLAGMAGTVEPAGPRELLADRRLLRRRSASTPSPWRSSAGRSPAAWSPRRSCSGRSRPAPPACRPPPTTPVDIIVVIQALIIVFVAAPTLVSAIWRVKAPAPSASSSAPGWGSLSVAAVAQAAAEEVTSAQCRASCSTAPPSARARVLVHRRRRSSAWRPSASSRGAVRRRHVRPQPTGRGHLLDFAVPAGPTASCSASLAITVGLAGALPAPPDAGADGPGRWPWSCSWRPCWCGRPPSGTTSLVGLANGTLRRATPLALGAPRRRALRALRRGQHRHRGHAPRRRLRRRRSSAAPPTTCWSGVLGGIAIGALLRGHALGPSVDPLQGRPDRRRHRASTSSSSGSPATSARVVLTEYPDLNRTEPFLPVRDPAARRTSRSSAPVALQQHAPRVRHVRPRRRHLVRALPHPLGPAGAGGRRAPVGGRHGRHQRARAPLPVGRSSAAPWPASAARSSPSTRQPVPGEHDRGQGLHRPRRPDLRPVAPHRGPRRRAGVRLRRGVPGPALLPGLADPVGVPADGALHRHARRRRRPRRARPARRPPTASRSSGDALDWPSLRGRGGRRSRPGAYAPYSRLLASAPPGSSTTVGSSWAATSRTPPTA